MKNFKRVFLACASFCVCFSLLGCSAQTSVAADINNKLYRVENTINAIEKINDNDLSFIDSETIEVSAFYPNNTRYGNHMYNGLGYYCYGNNCYTGYNGYNFRPYFGNINNGYYNGANNPYYNNINNPYYNNINNPYYNNAWANNGYFFGSNIDTYRPINQVNSAEHNHHFTKDIKDLTEKTHFEKINLTSSSKTCLECNNYTNMLIDNIKHQISTCYDLSNSIKQSEIILSNNQILCVNDLLKNIIATCNKINMAKGELDNILANVIASKTTMSENYSGLNSKYVRLLGCMDTRNSHLQTILNSLLQLECSITGQYQVDYNYGEDNANADSDNINTNVIIQEENCENCNNSSSNNNENCENCNTTIIDDGENINCENCNDCIGQDCTGGNDCINGKCQGDNCICNEDSNQALTDNNSEVNQKNTTINVVNNDDLIRDKLLENDTILVAEPDDIAPDYKPSIDYNDELTTLEYIHPQDINSIYNENDQENNKSLTA